MNYGSHDTDIFDGNSEELRQTISKLYDVKVNDFNFIITGPAVADGSKVGAGTFTG